MGNKSGLKIRAELILDSDAEFEADIWCGICWI